jgi:hypothetical protein
MRALLATDGSKHANAALAAACRILTPEEPTWTCCVSRQNHKGSTVSTGRKSVEEHAAFWRRRGRRWRPRVLAYGPYSRRARPPGR